MRLANLIAFKRYAANLERHKIPHSERVARLQRALESSAIFMSTRESARCAEFVNSY